MRNKIITCFALSCMFFVACGGGGGSSSDGAPAEAKTPFFTGLQAENLGASHDSTWTQEVDLRESVYNLDANLSYDGHNDLMDEIAAKAEESRSRGLQPIFVWQQPRNNPGYYQAFEAAVEVAGPGAMFLLEPAAVERERNSKFGWLIKQPAPTPIYGTSTLIESTSALLAANVDSTSDTIKKLAAIARDYGTKTILSVKVNPANEALENSSIELADFLADMGGADVDFCAIDLSVAKAALTGEELDRVLNVGLFLGKEMGVEMVLTNVPVLWSKMETALKDAAMIYDAFVRGVLFRTYRPTFKFDPTGVVFELKPVAEDVPVETDSPNTGTSLWLSSSLYGEKLGAEKTYEIVQPKDGSSSDSLESFKDKLGINK